MQAGDFSYGAPRGGASGGYRFALFGDHGSRRDDLAHDLTGAGWSIAASGDLAKIEALGDAGADGDGWVPGDVVVLDCPHIDAEQMARLARSDAVLARKGAPVLALTAMESLDGVFAALDQSAPQILVDPGRAELLVAIARHAGASKGARLRELSEHEKLELLRLSQQVDALAQSLDGLARKASFSSSFDLSSARADGTDDRGIAVAQAPRPAGPEQRGRGGFPDPAMVRRVILNRQARARHFDGALFADPAWDMLLDLTAAHGEGIQVSVSSLCIASGVPPATALRWISQMTEVGIFRRLRDDADRRRAFIALNRAALQGMTAYFAGLEEGDVARLS